MRIAYVTQSRFPTEKAHGNQVAQVCHALADLGHDVTLLAPTVGNAITEDPHRYYGLPADFRVVHPGSFDALGSPVVPGLLSFAVSMWSYRRTLRRYLRDHPADLLYVRSPALLAPLLATGKPVMLELHTLPKAFRAAFLRRCRRCFRVICLTTPMRDELVRWGVDPLRVSVEGDAVDLSRFTPMPDAASSRERWGVPEGVPVVGYAGSLVARNTLEKGVAELVDAFVLLKERGIRVAGLIVGGPRERRLLEEQRARAKGLTEAELRFHDKVPSTDVPSVLAACDVCVYPAPPSPDAFFLRDTSPLKLFEYLASGRPTVCADLPPVRDVVDASSVRLVTPGDTISLADGIAWVLEHTAEAATLAARGRAIVERHTWSERMRRIVGEVQD